MRRRWFATDQADKNVHSAVLQRTPALPRRSFLIYAQFGVESECAASAVVASGREPLPSEWVSPQGAITSCAATRGQQSLGLPIFLGSLGIRWCQ